MEQNSFRTLALPFNLRYMKFTFLRVLALLAISMSAYGQATLPAFWDFNGNTPTGWTLSGTASYTSANLVVVAPSCKLDNTNDFIQIDIADDPGNVVWWIGGATAGGSAWSGTFSVQESVNGTNWTNLKVYGNNDLSVSGMVKDSATANPASRHIRFHFTNKVSGSNVAVDDVTIRVAPASPAQEISVEYNGQPVPNNGTIYISSPVSQSTSFDLTVKNVGTVSPLSVTLPTLSGPQSSDYIVQAYPLTDIAANSSDLVTFSFNPPVAGTRLAQISIPNNDANENPYIINIFGTGGSFATEPTAQATSLTFPMNKTFRISGQFTAASPAPNGYIVLRKDGSAVTEIPADGSTYVVGDYIGNAQVVLVGTGTSFIPRNIVANTSYHFAVFSYNGVGGNTNYLTTSPLTGSVTTPANAIGNYYTGINKNASTFVTDLTAKINPHDEVFYGNYDEVMVNLFASRDTTGGQKVITCGYTGENFVYSPPFTWDSYSREHTFPHSWMPSFPADVPSEDPEYNDMHNLYPINFAQANQPRSNNPFGIVVTPLQSYLDGQLGYDANNVLVYEPRDAHKGRAARSMMYMVTCYNGSQSLQWSIPSQQNIDILKMWHFQFPPDEWDMARNDFIDSAQENRNPFVDSVDFVCYINFSNMTYVSAPTAPCYTVGVKENQAPEFNVAVYPVPSNGVFSISIMAEKTQDADMIVTDYTGRIIMQRNININSGPNLLQTDLSGYSSGVYNLSIRSNNSIVTKRLVLVN